MQMNFKKGGNFIYLPLLAASNSSRSTCVHAKLFNEAWVWDLSKIYEENWKKKQDWKASLSDFKAQASMGWK